jgi:chemotaxis-related protein WspB
MLLIMCHAGANRYAFETRHVHEVLPQVNLHQLTGSPSWLAGLLILRGSAIPVIDLTQLTQSMPCPNRFSSRIAIMQTVLNGLAQRFGVLAEQVVLQEFNDDHKESGVEMGTQTTLGKLHIDDQGVFQIVDPASLVSKDRQSLLFPGTEEQH